MSSFRQLKAKPMNHEKCLVDTLKHMGYSPVVGQDQTVRGDTRADNRKGYQILLRKEDTGSRGDIGFKKEADGFYTIGMDPYIMSPITPENFMDKVEGQYIVTKAKATAAKLGLRVVGAPQKYEVNGKQHVRLQYEKVGA
jgi:hypothetical protein